MPLVNQPVNPHNPYFGAWHRASAYRELNYRTPLVYWGADDTAVEEFHMLRYILSKQRSCFEYDTAHPAVVEALEEFGRPADWHLLALENPIKATDGTRVAYVRTEAKRQAHFYDKTGNKHLTATTAGKYLTRHWPHISADKIRNLVEASVLKFEMLTDLDDMISAVKDCTAYSCMQDNVSRNTHPYEVYDPKFGWKLAIVRQGDNIVARALCLENDKFKMFVRTYGKENGEGNTQSHPGLQHWLESQGFEYGTEWPEGAEFSYILYEDAHLAPYLDPGPDRRTNSDAQRVTRKGDVMVRSDEGEYNWCNTDGTPDEADSECYFDCENCDGRTHEDDSVWVGYHEDTHICDDCCHNHYTEVIGRNGRTYFIRDRNAVHVGSQAYDEDHLDENNIVQLHDGDYAHLDDTVYLEDSGEYYLCSDVADKPTDAGEVVRIEDSGDFVLREDAEWCEYDSGWILSEDAIEVADGKFVHTDDHHDYLLQLPRDEVEANCAHEDVAEMLQMWDDANAPVAESEKVLETVAFVD